MEMQPDPCDRGLRKPIFSATNPNLIVKDLLDHERRRKMGVG